MHDVDSDAQGSAFLATNIDGPGYNFQLAVQGLSGTPTGVHLHGPANTSQNAPILITLCGNPGPAAIPVCPVPDGDGVFAIQGTLTPELAAQWGLDDGVFQDWLEAGLIYVNVHTGLNPLGEVRGQLLYDQAPDSTGNDFWLAFPHNELVVPDKLTLFITGDTPTSGTVEIPGLGFVTGFAVTPPTVTAVLIPQTAELTAASGVESKGIHVTANDEVTVYGLNRIFSTTDAYLGLPTDVLGTEYLVMAYHGLADSYPSELSVVATTDNTTVTVTPSVNSKGGHNAGIPFNVTLDAGETFQLKANDRGDLTGSEVLSDEPVAVFGGAQCANVPQDFRWCDHLVEQMPPTSAWGKTFLTVPLATRTGGDTFRILASANDTGVHIDGAPAAVLDRGEYHEAILTDASVISASDPVLVAQYSNSTDFDSSTGDPAMMLIPPYEQYLGSYTVTTPGSGFSLNFVNVVAPDAGIAGLQLDGNPLAAAFSAIGSTGFSGAQVPVGIGSHTFSGPLPFGVFSYGFDYQDSYAYPGGMSLARVANVSQLLLAPGTADLLTGDEHCVTATVLDQNGSPLEGIRVDFNVTGANSAFGFGFTDVSGEVVFCYTSASEGDDTIAATAAHLYAEARATFVTPNEPPDISGAMPSIPCLWPPNRLFTDVTIQGVVDADGDVVTIVVTGITSDEPTSTAMGMGGGDLAPDASGVGTDTASLRAERQGGTGGFPVRFGVSDGRVYEVFFDASDGIDTVGGSVLVGVPIREDDPVCGVQNLPPYDATAVN